MRTREQIVTLIAEIEEELKQLARLRKSILDTERKKKKRTEDKDIYEESEALKLHNFYTACEHIFGEIITTLNAEIPQNAEWHKRLLRLMTLKIPKVRPAVISTELYSKLEEYLRFRHVIRNIYAFELDSSKLQALIDSFEDVYNHFVKDIHSFIDFLRSLAEEIE
jgi:phenylalanyl-tRNA synthetase alpha subunit